MILSLHCYTVYTKIGFLVGCSCLICIMQFLYCKVDITELIANKIMNFELIANLTLCYSILHEDVFRSNDDRPNHVCFRQSVIREVQFAT